MYLKPKTRVLFAFTILLLPMLACSSLLGGQDDEAEVPAAVEPAGSPSGQEGGEDANTSQGQDAGQQDTGSEQSDTGDSGAEVAAISIQPSMPINNDALPFQTYQIRMRFSAVSGGNTSSVEMNIARDVPNQAVSYQMSATGMPDMEELDADSIVFVAIGDNTYLSADGECMLMPSGMNNPVEQVWTRNSFLLMDDDMQVQLVGPQNLDGLPVQEYQLEGINAADMLDASGTLFTYSLPDGQEVVVKADMTGTSATNPMTEAREETTINYTFELFAVDAPLTIDIPEGCENPVQIPVPGALAEGDSAAPAGAVPAGDAPAAPAPGQATGNYPVYPGSTFVGGYAGAENYMIPQSAIDAAQRTPKDFYVQEFAVQGYVLGQELAAGPSLSLTFQKEGAGPVQVMLVGENGDTNVTIIGVPTTP